MIPYFLIMYSVFFSINHIFQIPLFNSSKILIQFEIYYLQIVLRQINIHSGYFPEECKSIFKFNDVYIYIELYIYMYIMY